MPLIRFLTFSSYRCMRHPCREDLLCRKKPVEGGREPGIDRHLHQDFGDFVARQADIETCLYMHLQLRGGIAHGGERGDGRDLTGAQIKTGAAVDIAEGKFEQIGGEVRRDICERRDDLFAGLAVDLSERALAAGETAVG